MGCVALCELFTTQIPITVADLGEGRSRCAPTPLQPKFSLIYRVFRKILLKYWAGAPPPRLGIDAPPRRSSGSAPVLSQYCSLYLSGSRPRTRSRVGQCKSTIRDNIPDCSDKTLRSTRDEKLQQTNNQALYTPEEPPTPPMPISCTKITDKSSALGERDINDMTKQRKCKSLSEAISDAHKILTDVNMPGG